MKKVFGLIVILTMLMAAVPMGAATAQSSQDPCDPLVPGLPAGLYVPLGGSTVCVWRPSLEAWNKDFVIFAHGYMDPTTPAGTIPWDQLVIVNPANPTDIKFLPGILLQMGYGFAVTSYPKNGLAVLEGVMAVQQLAGAIRENPLVKNIFLVGASEGGLVTALAIEQNSSIGDIKLFQGGVTTCGPVGNFRGQVNYWGDFRVILDVLFPTLKAALNDGGGSPVNIPTSVQIGWGTMQSPGPLQNLVSLAIATHPQQTAQLLLASKAPIDSANPTITTNLTVRGLLDYNIKATNEARQELAGNPTPPVDLTSNNFQPFDNKNPYRFYWGLTYAQNLQVERFAANWATLNAMKPYETTGKIKAPLVALHTTGDPIVPYWHEPLYLFKVWMAGQGAKFFSIPVARYGHCAFTAQEAIFAFAVMVYKATGQVPLALLNPQTDPAPVLTLDEYNQMMEQYGPMQTEPKPIYIPMLSN